MKTLGHVSDPTYSFSIGAFCADKAAGTLVGTTLALERRKVAYLACVNEKPNKRVCEYWQRQHQLLFEILLSN
jgi:hypothetical protein